MANPALMVSGSRQTSATESGCSDRSAVKFAKPSVYVERQSNWGLTCTVGGGGTQIPEANACEQLLKSTCKLGEGLEFVVSLRLLQHTIPTVQT